MKVLFVCTGNTCRSPLAEAIAKREAEKLGLTDVEFGSAGAAAWSGAAASEGSLLVGMERRMDLSGHKSRSLTRELVEQQDLILGMGPEHVAAARDLGGEDRTFLLDAYASQEQSENEVSDPFGQQVAAYRKMADDLEAKVTRVVQRLATRKRGEK